MCTVGPQRWPDTLYLKIQALPPLKHAKIEWDIIALFVPCLHLRVKKIKHGEIGLFDIGMMSGDLI